MNELAAAKSKFLSDLGDKAKAKKRAKGKPDPAPPPKQASLEEICSLLAQILKAVNRSPGDVNPADFQVTERDAEGNVKAFSVRV